MLQTGVVKRKKSKKEDDPEMRRGPGGDTRQDGSMVTRLANGALTVDLTRAPWCGEDRGLSILEFWV